MCGGLGLGQGQVCAWGGLGEESALWTSPGIYPMRIRGSILRRRAGGSFPAQETLDVMGQEGRSLNGDSSPIAAHTQWTDLVTLHCHSVCIGDLG